MKKINNNKTEELLEYVTDELKLLHRRREIQGVVGIDNLEYIEKIKVDIILQEPCEEPDFFKYYIDTNINDNVLSKYDVMGKYPINIDIFNDKKEQEIFVTLLNNHGYQDIVEYFVYNNCEYKYYKDGSIYNNNELLSEIQFYNNFNLFWAYELSRIIDFFEKNTEHPVKCNACYNKHIIFNMLVIKETINDKRHRKELIKYLYYTYKTNELTYIKPLFLQIEENLIVIPSGKCKANCGTRSGEKYKGYCLRCFIYTFPDQVTNKKYKVREQHLVDFIKETYKNMVFIFDKQINNGCSKRRPDIYIDLYTHVIVIECDENQHKSYKTICENKRIMEISNDFANRPIVFIRFNPDSYTKNNKKIPSCFEMLKSREIYVLRNKKDWSNRLSDLKKLVDYYLDFIPDKTITNEYLFFDSDPN